MGLGLISVVVCLCLWVRYCGGFGFSLVVVFWACGFGFLGLDGLCGLVLMLGIWWIWIYGVGSGLWFSGSICEYCGGTWVCEFLVGLV